MNTPYISRAKSVEWATPTAVFDALHARFGFTIDVAADDYNHLCPRYFTKEQDGLRQTWAGESVWCNPPYGRGIADWVKKAHDEASSGGTLVVMLLPARTDTKWFHEYVLPHGEIEFVKGRLKFGDAKAGAPFPSMVVIFGAQGRGVAR